jgi:hypothetical protein
MKKIFRLMLLAGLSSTLLAGCLKDDAVTDYSDSSIKPVVLIPNGNFPRTNAAPLLTFEVSTQPSEIRLYARVSWSKPLGRSIDVTFQKNPTLITDFNARYGTHFSELNADAYSIPTLKVTIPGDQNEAYIPIQLFTEKVDLSKENMLAFTMTDASGEVIASNFAHMVFPIGVKNKYDGAYNARIKSVGWAAYGIADGTTFSWPAGQLHVVTAGANSFTLWMNNLGWDFLPAFTASGGVTGFGATAAIFTFDNATNKLVNVDNTYADDGRGRDLVMNPSVTDSRYDPATKTLYLSFIMKQTGRPDQYFYDTLVYNRSR